MVTGFVVIDKNDNIYFSISPRFQEYVDFLKKITENNVIILGRRMFDVCKDHHWLIEDAPDVYIAQELRTLLELQPIKPKIVLGNDLIIKQYRHLDRLLIIKMEDEEETNAPLIRLVYDETHASRIGKGFGYNIMTYDLTAKDYDFAAHNYASIKL